ncbi:MAG: hypothetical protein ABJL35_15030 [Parasphingorhabdus sp.]|uniref:hypothetical protein n=1 Tax=Parasphingorhabdus sp. TaxID=2709688 RepID=UPI003299A287
MPLTRLAAPRLGSPGLLACSGLSVFHLLAYPRAFEAGAGLAAALGLLALGPLTLNVAGVVDKSETVRARHGVAVWVF